MESLVRLVILLFACHFLAGLCSSGFVLLIGLHLNILLTNIFLILIPIFGISIFKFPLSLGYVIGSLIPSSFYWIGLLLK